jgi:hypothetical protein
MGIALAGGRATRVACAKAYHRFAGIPKTLKTGRTAPGLGLCLREQAQAIKAADKAAKAPLPLFPIMLALSLLIAIVQVRSISATNWTHDPFRRRARSAAAASI